MDENRELNFIIFAALKSILIIMTITVKSIDYAQQASLLAYLKRKKIDFEFQTIKNSDMRKEEMDAKIDRGIEEFKQGRTKKLAVSEINSFLGL